MAAAEGHNRARPGQRAILLAKAFAPNLGGVETYSEQVAFALARLGYEVDVVTQFHGPVGLETREADGVHIRVTNVGEGPQWLVGLRMAWAFLRLRPTARDVSVIHATTWRAALPARLFAGRRYSITVHGREVAQTRSPLLRFLMAAIFRGAGRWVYISHYSQSVCASDLPPPISAKVAWNGLSWPDQPAGDALEPRPPVRALSACQLTRRKNIDAAIRALCEARRQGLDVTLAVAGRGPEEEHLRQLVSDLGLDDSVTFLGFVPRSDMPQLYRSHSIFLHPHQHAHDPGDFESFCIAVADAMAFGNIVIAGRDGAPAEYIEVGRNGYLVDGNDVGDICRRLVEASTLSAAQASALREEASRFAHASFNWDVHAETIVSLGPHPA